MGNTSSCMANLCKKKAKNPNNSVKSRKSFTNLFRSNKNNQKDSLASSTDVDEQSSLLSNQNNNDDIESQNQQQQQQQQQQIEDYSNLDISQEIKIKYPIQLKLIIEQAETNFLQILQNCKKIVENLQLVEKGSKNTDYSEYQNVFKSKEDKHPELNIYLKSYLDDKFRITCFYYTWEIKNQTDLQKVFDIFNNMEISREIDQNMEIYEQIQNINEKDSIFYLQYKKVLIASPRDFVYIKRNNINLDKGEAYFVTKSILLQNKDEIKKKTRGDILLSGTMFKVDKENQSIKVTVFSEVDPKLSLPLAMTKPASVNQIKKLVQATNDKIQQILQ